MATPAQGRLPLTEYLKAQLTTDRELARVLELAARQSAASVRGLPLVEGSSITDMVNNARFLGVLSEVTRIQRVLWENEDTGIRGIILRSFPRAEKAATTAFGLLEGALTAVLGETLSKPIIAAQRAAVHQGFELDRVRRARLLSPRVYKNSALASGAVERQIRAGIIQGMSARDLAKRVERFISARTPGGVSYAALRLARTELNNAFHEEQKRQGDAPWIKSMKWNTSGSHPRKDACDTLANQNLHGLGKGCYPADDVPDKPHPQCLCYTTFVTISEREMLALLPRGQRIAS